MTTRILFLLSTAAVLTAAPVTVTVSGIATGALGGAQFQNAKFTFTLTSDTSMVTTPPCCATHDLPMSTPATFSISGMASGTFTDNQTLFVDPQADYIGFAHFSDGNLIDLHDNRLANYDLKSSIGPYTGIPSIVTGNVFRTSAGLLTFYSGTTVTFQIAVAPAAPSTIPVIDSIVNAANYLKGAAPNTFVSIYGLNFGTQDSGANIAPATSFNGISVQFNGKNAPLTYVSGTRGFMNVIVPAELSETGSVNVTVQNAVGVSATYQMQMAAADVGMFRVPDPSNARRVNGAVLFANTAWLVMPNSTATALKLPACTAVTTASACGKPAKVGDTISLFLTGLGKATPGGDPNGAILPTGTLAPVSGSPLYQTLQTPTVTIGGVAAQVSFSGIAPGNEGLYQINVTIPPGVQSGDDVPALVTMPSGSNDTITISIG